MNESAMLDALLGLLTLPPDARAGLRETLGAPVGSLRRAALLRIAQRERCHPNLLQLWAAEEPLSDDETALAEALQAKAAGAQRLTQSLPPGIVLLKGANIHRHYPPDTPRYSGDVDVLVPDLRALGSLHSRLVEQGYQCGASGLWGLGPGRDLSRCVGSLRYQSASDAQAVSVEVQVGGFPLSLARVLPADELLTQAHRLGTAPYVTLEPTRQLMLALADFMVRVDPLTVRHLADLCNLLQQAGDAIDPPVLARACRHWGLGAGLDKLHAAVAAKGLTDRMPAMLRRLRALDLRAARPEARPPLWQRARSAVVGRMASGLTRWGGERFGARPWSRAAAAVGCVLDGGLRVYGIPLSFKGVADPMLLRAADSLYLANGAGLFALSLTGLADQEGRRAALAAVRADGALHVLAKMKEAHP
jgi:hypothetical protein